MPRDILEHSAAGQPATLTSLPGPLRTLPRVKARIVEFGDPGATDERFAQLEGNLATISGGRRARARHPG